MASFEDAVKLTLIREGGSTYTNDPDDPGGETKYGISKRAFPAVDIRNLTKPEAEAIYREHYWNRINGDDIQSQPIAENYFDTAVNMGVGTATKLVQLGIEVKVDGIMGSQTLAALNKTDEEFFLAKFTIAKIARYSNICNKNRAMSKYLLGWVNRTLGATA